MIIHAGVPKCGTTWLEALTCELFGLKKVIVYGHLKWDRSDTEKFLKDLRGRKVSVREHFMPEMHAIFHEFGVPVVFIYRHPADMVTSLHHHRARNGEGTADDFASTCDAFAKSLPRLAWRGLPGVFSTRYEDLIRDASAVAVDLARFLGRPAPPERVRRAVEKTSFAEMWGREPGEEDAASFGRKGVVGDHANFLVGDRLKLWDDRFPGIAGQWGYGPDYIREATPVRRKGGDATSDMSDAARRAVRAVPWFGRVIDGLRRRAA